MFLLLSFIAEVDAANFNVSPIIGDISAGSDVAVFEVSNHDERSLSFQVQAFSWTQVLNEDRRRPADDLLIVPPVATIAPGKSQLVRIALRNSDRTAEHAYRIVIRELPQEGRESKGLALQTLLAFDLPLFFAPDDATRELEWEVAKNGAGKIIVRASSTGSRYARLDGIRIEGANGRVISERKGPLYILAEAQRSWLLTTRSGADTSRGDEVRLVYSMFGQEKSISLAIE